MHNNIAGQHVIDPHICGKIVYLMTVTTKQKLKQ